MILVVQYSLFYLFNDLKIILKNTIFKNLGIKVQCCDFAHGIRSAMLLLIYGKSYLYNISFTILFTASS